MTARNLIACLAALALLLVGGMARAETPLSWIIKQRVGNVWITSLDGRVLNIAVNEAVPEQTTIATRKTGRVVLMRGDEFIIMQPNTRLVIRSSSAVTTRLTQSDGTASYMVTRRATPHFRVDTPFIAAVVKGTTFTVDVSKIKASVRVREGLVAVKSRGGRAATLVYPGMEAAVAGAHTTVIDMTETSGKVRRVEGDEISPGATPFNRLDWDTFGTQASQNQSAAAPGEPPQPLTDATKPQRVHLRFRTDEEALFDLIPGGPRPATKQTRHNDAELNPPDLDRWRAGRKPAANTPQGQSSLLKSLYVPPYRQKNRVTVESAFASSLLGRIAIGMMAVLAIHFLWQWLRRVRSH